MAEDYAFSRDALGNPVKAPASQAEDLFALNQNVIGQQEAINAARAQQNLSYVDQNWGTAGKLAMGGLSGLSLGIAPGLGTSLGLIEPGHLAAAKTSPWYTAGDIAGTVAPAFVGDEAGVLGKALKYTPAGLLGAGYDAAGAALGKALPEVAGLLGQGAALPIRMAARGATEGAIINLGHQVGENMVQNKPLAAEAMAAMGDGALFGGLVGGGFGTLGYLGSKAVEGASRLARKAATGGSEMGAIQRVAGEFGGKIEGEVVESAHKAGPEQGKETLRKYRDVLKEGGADIGSSASKKYSAAETYTRTQEGVRVNAVDTMESQAPQYVPSQSRLRGRILNEVVVPNAGTPQAAEAAAEAKSFWKRFVQESPEDRANWNKSNDFKTYAQWVEDGQGGDLKGTERRAKYDDYKASFDRNYADYRAKFTDNKAAENFPTTWKGLIEARDSIAEAATTPIRRQILSILDKEIESAMNGAGEVMGQKVADAAKEYAASSAGIKLGKAIQESLGPELHRTTGAALSMRDVGTAGGMAFGLGKPASAATWLSAKGIGKMMHDKVGPWLAQMAYDNSIAAKAAESTNAVKGRITKSLDRFFAKPKAGKAVSAAYAASKQRSSGPDRATYEAEANRVQRLISDNHMSRVQRYADDIARQGYQDLANQLMAVNQRAVLYVMNSMPKRKGAKALTSLRPQPIPMTLDMDEHRFLRQLSGMDFNQLMDDFDSGKLSRDQVRTAWNVMPEIRNELAQQASMRIAEMKAKGESLPMDKVMNLSLLLDAPLDRVAEADFINPVQQALNTPASPPPGPQGPPPANMAASIDATGMLTPLQQNLMG